MISDERQMIRDAIARLLAGDPIRSDGSLTIVSLAQESGVKRHFLTHKHKDLREEFYSRVSAQGHVPESEVRLRRDLEATKIRLERAVKELQVITQERDELLRLNNLLGAEHRALVAGGKGAGAVVPFRLRPSD
jgi:hypothetical protein